MSEMRVLFVNNEGGGFADYVGCPEGCTAVQFFEQEMSGDPKDYIIRVNREAVIPSHRLTTGDRVTITPKNIKGA